MTFVAASTPPLQAFRRARHAFLHSKLLPFSHPISWALVSLLCCVAGAVAQPNGLFREYYSGISGSGIANLTNHASFPNGWTSTNIVTSSFETAQNTADNYGQRLRALLAAPTNGNHVLWVASDDQSVLYLSSDESAFNKVLIARVNGSTSYRQWTRETNQQSEPLALEAGRRYYIEALHKEGTGSDNLSVRWRLPGGTIEEPIPASRLRPFGMPAVSPPAITSQPTNVTAVENSPVLFRVGVSNLDAVGYQWLRNGTNVPNARGASFGTNAALADNGAGFRCALSNALGAVTSVVAMLTVIADTTRPQLCGAANIGSNTVQVMFSEGVEPGSATNAANYGINNGVTVSSATFGGSSRVVTLVTSPLQRGTSYTVTVNNVRDLAAAKNVIAANSQASFVASLKGVFREVFAAVPGNSVADLTNSGAYPGWPTSAELMTSLFEAPGNVADNYGQRLRAQVIPPVSGAYTFWIAADETATLALATDGAPDNAAVVASVTAATLQRQWDAQPSQKSAALTLTAGQPCYLEVLMKEGIGTDYLAVRWQLPDGTIEEPIPVVRLTPYGMGPPVIGEQPTNVTVAENSAAVFRVGLSNVDPATYQWQQNGTNIPGATNAIYTDGLALLSENGSVLQCVLGNPIGATTTVPVTLTVTADVTAPALINVLNAGQTSVVVFFSETVDAASASRGSNYTIAGLSVLGAVLRSDGRAVTLRTTALTPGANYTLAVNNVRDRAATPNVIAPNSQQTFVALEFFPEDLGTLAQPGGFIAATNGVDLTAAGGDIGGTSDQCNFSHQVRTGNFDVQVRVQRLDFADPFAKAALMAREDLSTNSRHASVVATPTLAGVFFQYRTNAGGGAAMSGGFPVNYPFTWLRLRRMGNQFTGYASLDGQKWTQLGTVSNGLPATVYLGFALSSRDAGAAVVAEFRDFAENTGGTIGALPATSEPLGPSSRRTGLVISELMYHPAPRTDGRKLEYVELFNSNPYPQDIGGFRLSGEVDFRFPAGTVLKGGAFLVVARFPADMQAVYGIGNVTGPFTNNFSNQAGTVRLRNRTDAILLEVNYDSKPPWPVAADGAGHSLVLARPSFGEGDPRAWAQSDVVGGSPGRPETVRFEPQRSVVINEFLANTDLPALDYIELYNHSTVPVDLSGCWLSDDAGTNKFRIPGGTVIAPTGLVYFTEAALGFALSSAGETVFLVNANGTRVLDAIRFEGQENGVASGRYPDGAPQVEALEAQTPGAPNAAARVHEIVINEIMYHPVTEDDDLEYVELHNRGTNMASLANWRFSDGIDFTFGADVVIPPGGYLVVAKNAVRLLTNYVNLNLANTVGNFEGSLRNSCERLALSKPEYVVTTNGLGELKTNTAYILVDEVTYGTGGQWGRWSDGGGSSLELIDPRSDNRLAANWAESDETAKSVWTPVTATGTLDNSQGTNWDSLQMYLQDPGECLVDNVSVHVAGSANLVPNPDFESGTNGWFAQGNHYLSGLENSGQSSGRSLHVRASGRGDTGANRVRTTLSSTYSNNATGTITASARWLRGRPEILFRLRGNHLEAPGTLAVPPNLGTPGARNSQYRTNAGPAIGDVTHQTVLPAAGEPVVVTARVHDPDGLAGVQLNYRVDPAGTPATVPMRDDGTGGDAVPGDGVFSAKIAGQTNGALAAFYLQAVDASAVPATTRFPNDAPERECLVRFGETQPVSAYGTYRFWLTQTNLNKWINRERLSNEPIEGTFVYGNGRAIYNAGNQYAGSPYHSPNFNSPVGNTCDYYVTLPGDDPLLAATEFTLQVPGNGGSDSICQDEQTAYWLGEQLGVAALHRRPVNFIIAGVRRNIILEDTQQPNDDFTDQWYPDDPDGDLYKVMVWFEMNDGATAFTSAGATLNPITTTGGVKKLARYRQNFGKRAFRDSASNYTNLFNLVDLLGANATGDAYTAKVLAGLDVEQWARVFAVERIVGNSDVYGNGGGQNLYLYKPTAGRWQSMMWDIDFAFSSQPATSTLFTFSDAPMTRLFGHAPFLRLYWQALEEAANGPLLADRVNPLLEAKYAAFQASGISAAAPGPIETYIAQRRDQILTLLAGVRAPLAINSNNGNRFTNASTVVTLSGTAPIAARTLHINGAAYPVTWTSITNWTVQLPLTAQTNLLVVQGLDARGNLLSNGTAAITVCFNGPVARAEDSLVINELMCHPAVSNASYVEIFNRSTNTTFDLWNYRLKGVDFNFPAGTTLGPRGFLTVVKDVAAFQTAHGTNISVAGPFDGKLDPDGETLTLLKLGATPAEDVVIDKVKYEAVAPWPAGPASPDSGVALQLIDPAQDNARVSNWADDLDWRYFTFTGVASGTRLILYLDRAGDLYLDDIILVAGAVAGLGTNRVRNGDFETPLADGWSLLGTAATNSTVSGDVAHGGAGSLHLVFGQPGSPAAYLYQDLTNMVTTDVYTLSFWYRPTPGAGTLVARLGSQFRPAINTAAMAATPGASNSVAGSVAPYPLLWINEVQPDNPDGLQDNTGTAQPWIELFNNGTNVLSLDGFCLANTYTNLNQWAFPTGTLISPGEFRVVFADGQPWLSTGTVLHTSFRLDPANGAVVLARGAQILDYINYADLASGVSYGSHPDGQLFDRQTFHYVTPGASNNPAPVPVAINEWMASNTRTLLDPATGRYDDWFELYNFGDAAVDLSGFYLTDDLGEKAKWRIPAGTTIAPRRFLMVWADDDTTGTNTAGHALHAAFQLSRRGDEIGLFSPEGLQAAAVTFGSQASDVSQGLYPNGQVGGVYHSMPTPTPGTNNVITNNLFAPTLAAIPDCTVIEGTLLAFACRATDPDQPSQTLTFSLLAGAPYGAGVHPLSGEFAWTPLESQGGASYAVTVKVSDNGLPALSDTKTFNVTVLKTNSAPRVAVIPDRMVEENQPVNVFVAAVDDDLPAQSLTVMLVSGPDGAVIDAGGNLTWTPDEAQGPGTNAVVVAVTDSGTPMLAATQSFVIVVSEVNAAPTLAPAEPLTIDELSALRITNMASDVDRPANSLIWSLLAGPTNAVLDSATGMLSWTPAEADGPGTNEFVLVVTDNGEPPLSATQRVSVVVDEVNEAPVLQPIGDWTVHPGMTVALTNVATDADLPTNVLRFALSNAPAGATIDALTGVFIWTPTAAEVGTTNEITVVVADAADPPLRDSRTFNVVVATGPRIRSITLLDGKVRLEWEAAPGVAYRLQYCPDLGAAQWSDLPGAVLATEWSASMTTSISDSTQRFYRVLAGQ